MWKSLVGRGLFLAVILAGLLLLVWTEPPQRRRLRIVNRLWYGGGAQLVVGAFEARDTFKTMGESDKPGAFVPWDQWPAECRDSVLRKKMDVVATEAIDGLIVTSFVKQHDAEARWFYVVPDNGASTEPWFRVVAMTPEFCLYSSWPRGHDMIVEERTKGPLDPMRVIKRLSRPTAGEAVDAR